MNLTSSYYITLLAHDPSLQKTFQVRVDEREYGSLDLTVAIARPKKDQNEGDLCCIVLFYFNTSQEYKIKSHLLIKNVACIAAETTKEPFVPHFCCSAVSDGVFQGPLPDWPSEDALRHDRNRFYEVRLLLLRHIISFVLLVII